jgi:hypothetical protein
VGARAEQRLRSAVRRFHDSPESLRQRAVTGLCITNPDEHIISRTSRPGGASSRQRTMDRRPTEMRGMPSVHDGAAMACVWSARIMAVVSAHVGRLRSPSLSKRGTCVDPHSAADAPGRYVRRARRHWPCGPGSSVRTSTSSTSCCGCVELFCGARTPGNAVCGQFVRAPGSSGCAAHLSQDCGHVARGGRPAGTTTARNQGCGRSADVSAFIEPTAAQAIRGSPPP